MNPTVWSRADWGASAPLGPAMRLPVREANLHHSVTALTSDPIRDMRTVERVGVQRFGRFSYSWAYHRPSRSLLEGAGNTIGAHTAGRNSTSLGLVLIGNYDEQPLDNIAVQDLGAALRWLVDTGGLTEDFVLRGHRDHKATACPGRHAYARLGEIRRAVTLEDTMTPEQERKLDQIHAALVGPKSALKTILDDARLNGPTHARILAAVADPASIAEEIAQRLPGTSGPVKVADLETALRNVLGSLND